MRITLNDTELTVRCPGGSQIGAKTYRKGFYPFLFPVHGDSVIVNDTESILVYCHFQDTRLAVQHVENATVKESQEKIYQEKKVAPRNRKPSVNVLMIDGVSRPQFIRGLKGTSELLEAIHQNPELYGFDVFQFMRYSVVGRNSISNLSPLVSGRQLQNATRLNGVSAEFNHDSWLWKHANNNGYATLFADEQCPYPVHITPWQTPTFAGGTDQIASAHHHFGDIYCNAMNAQYGSDKRCMFGKQAHEYMFDYLDSFFSHYNNTPKFSWSILYEGHEPTLSILPLLDQDLQHYLQRSLLKNKNTVTVLLSDHGMHYGPYPRFPYPGKLEHHFPSLFMLVPTSFLHQHPEVGIALRQLEQALITAVDVYSILLHLISWPNPPTGDVPQGLRNLLVPGAIKEDRTCEEANIPADWCFCHPRVWKSRAIPLIELLVQKRKKMTSSTIVNTTKSTKRKEEDRHLLVSSSLEEK